MNIRCISADDAEAFSTLRRDVARTNPVHMSLFVAPVSGNNRPTSRPTTPGMATRSGKLSLSADGNTLAAGAIDEDSASTGINGDQNNNSAPASGSVYLY